MNLLFSTHYVRKPIEAFHGLWKYISIGTSPMTEILGTDELFL